jgi:general secretion pathway protein G
MGNNKNKKSRGFTLIEIMVVLVIIGIMAALIVPRVIGRADDARKVAAKSDISAMMNALKLYNLDNMRYPTNQQGLQSLATRPNVAPIPNNYKDGGYLDKLPLDPWGHPYQYQNPGKHGEVDVYSLGPDGAEGGNEDSGGIMGNWQQ